MLGTEIVMEKALHTFPPLGKRGQLLVVDDDNDIQMLLSRTLSSKGYDVAVAGNGIEAMTLLFSGSYDWVIAGFEMPLMNGWELACLVKEQSSETPVFVARGSMTIGIGESLRAELLS